MRWILFVIACAWALAAWTGYAAASAMAKRYWPAVPCLIETSFVEELGGDKPYVFKVHFRYERAGKKYEGRIFKDSVARSHDIAEVDRLARLFPAGSHRVCYVDPRNPTVATLAHEPVWPAAVISAMTFVAGCALIGILSPARSFTTHILQALTGPFLLTLGLGGYVAFFGLPLWAGLRSLGWRETPCVVESGQLRRVYHYSFMSSFTVYWPDVIYRYEVAGVSYRANTYNASDPGSPWYYGARGIVRRHPSGMKTTCYVNPADPTEAVMTRILSGTQWFGVWPLTIALLGSFTIFESTTRNVIKFGSHQQWGTLILGAVTASALTFSWISAADLLRDWHAGVAEWHEYVITAFAAVMGIGWSIVWVAWARKPGGSDHRKPLADKPPVVWDPEIDERIRPGSHLK
jgi:hypothetical protein